jgi:hypothetical protein
MKKIGLLLMVFASLGVVGCGDECGELADKWEDCCNGISDEATRTSCKQQADLIEDADECDPDAFQCPFTGQ